MPSLPRAEGLPSLRTGPWPDRKSWAGDTTPAPCGQGSGAAESPSAIVVAVRSGALRVFSVIRNAVARRSGFTLPEILVTVAVVAVLAAVVVPTVTQYINKGDRPASLQDIDQVRDGVTAFTADVRKYPGDLRQLTTAIVADDAQATGFTSDSVEYNATDVGHWRGAYFSGTLASGSFT